MTGKIIQDQETTEGTIEAETTETTEKIEETTETTDETTDETTGDNTTTRDNTMTVVGETDSIQTATVTDPIVTYKLSYNQF